MNWTPTALLIFVVVVIMAVSIFGGYFGYGTSEMVGGELPSGWSLVTSAASFYGDMCIFSVEEMPEIFYYIWWFLHLIGLFCVVKIIWPGA